MIIDGKHYRRDIFGKLVPAMEAGENGPEDLTATTDTMMRQASGKRADPGNMTPPTTSDETQAQNDDLNAGTPPPDAADPAEGLDEVANTGDAMAGGDLGGGDPTAPPTDMGMGDQLGADLWKKKNIYQLQQRISNFKNSVATTYDTLSNYSTPTATTEQRQVYSSAMNHLTDAKTILEDMLVTPFTDDNYVTKLRQYIALRHVYSAVLDMLSIYFDILNRSSGAETEIIDNA